MYRKKSKEEILKQFYLCKRDLRVLFQIGEVRASKIYRLAEKIDDDELGEYRIEPMKVRITSVCKVTGLNLNTLQKLVKEN